VFPKPVPFARYSDSGAYHWVECDRRSSSYNPPLRARYEAVLRRVAAAKRVLDVGCGDGYLMGLLSTGCERVFGVDPEQRGVALASAQLRSFGNCHVARASCYALPFRPESFDVVLLADVIEHLEYPALCLQELRRVLVPGGMAFVTTPLGRPERKVGWNHVKEYTGPELAELLGHQFASVRVTYLWPRTWFRLYSTPIGWRGIRWLCRLLDVNPFRREGMEPKRYEQILAVCR